MATVDIQVPLELWDDAEKTGSIVIWLYKDGAKVTEGEVIAEMLFEKATFELVAPATGTLHIAVEPEVPVALGDSIGTITT
ncbi:MAG: lipoyl domain-containing protein [Porticoccaceae bacterium]|nr:lipoyl domain-containing protein [Porticoccaceae bacterium]